jgi:hypothetical protein
MTPDEKKQKFEEDLIEVAIAEYYQWADTHNAVRSEAQAKMFYEAMRIGVVRGINFATNQYIQSLKNFEEKKNEQSNTNNIE